jgi:DNA-binding NarL/FixJ family response regulator
VTEGIVSDPGDSTARLTPRERQVLEHAARGMSNREIGEALNIAEQTVKNHLSAAMRKLSINDRTHAVVVAIRDGLIAMPIGVDQAPAFAAETPGKPVD